MVEHHEMTDILYCEDEGDYTELVAINLSSIREEIELTVVTSGSEVLQEFSPEAYDCILSDYDMSGMDGLELLCEIRESHPKFPFILYTGRGSEEIAGEAIRSGVTDYLQKGAKKSHFRLLEKRISNAVEGYRAKRTREKLATRFELIEKASPDAFWDRDLMEDTVELGVGFEQLFGYEPGWRDDSFAWWYERVHPDDRERLVSEIEQVIDDTDNFYEGKLRFECADGTYSHVIGRGYIIYEGSVPVREVGIVIDLAQDGR